MKQYVIYIILSALMLGCGTAKQNTTDTYRAENISEIPDSVFQMKNLQVVSIGPQWLMIAPVTGYKGDEGIKKVKELPAELCQLKNLKVLNLTNQDLTSLPKCVYRMKNLEQLDLSFNSKFDIGNLLQNISRLKRLKKLDLYGVPVSTNDSIKLKNAIPNVELILTKRDIGKPL